MIFSRKFSMDNFPWMLPLEFHLTFFQKSLWSFLRVFLSLHPVFLTKLLQEFLEEFFRSKFTITSSKNKNLEDFSAWFTRTYLKYCFVFFFEYLYWELSNWFCHISVLFPGMLPRHSPTNSSKSSYRSFFSIFFRTFQNFLRVS